MAPLQWGLPAAARGPERTLRLALSLLLPAAGTTPMHEYGAMSKSGVILLQEWWCVTPSQQV
jgi:hypothetical protein